MVQPLSASSVSCSAVITKPAPRTCSLWKVVCTVGAIAAVIFGYLSGSNNHSLAVVTPKPLAEPPFFPNATRSAEVDLEIEKEYGTDGTFEDLLVCAMGGKAKFEELKKHNNLSSDFIESCGLVVNPKGMTSAVMIGEWNHQPYIAFKFKNMRSGLVRIGAIFRYKSITWQTNFAAPFQISHNALPGLQAFGRLMRGLPLEIITTDRVESFRLTNEEVNDR